MSPAARIAPIATLLVLAACLYPLQRWIDATSTPTVEQEALYLSNGTAVKRMSLGFESMLADIYWMRTIQYFGDKILNDQTVLNERGPKLKLLYPLTDLTTTLDPRNIPAYRFGGIFAHDYVDPVQGYVLLEKAIHNNPNEWRLYQDLAFLYWTDGRCREASDTYLRATNLPGAPSWLGPLAGVVEFDCGNVATARDMYARMYETADDECCEPRRSRSSRESTPTTRSGRCASRSTHPWADGLLSPEARHTAPDAPRARRPTEMGRAGQLPRSDRRALRLRHVDGSDRHEPRRRASSGEDVQQGQELTMARATRGHAVRGRAAVR